MRFELEFGRSARQGAGRSVEPLRLLILADLAGASESRPLAERRLARVDVDNFETLLARHAPSVALGGDASDAESVLRFRSLDDFHPDQLVRSAALFRKLRELRTRLTEPATFAAAAAELRGEAVVAAGGGAAAGAEQEAAPSMFDRLLGRAARPDREAPSPKVRHAVDALIQGIVAPHVVALPDPQQAQLVAAVDVAMSDAMRGLLHYPPLQRLEATWRGIRWLVTSLELGEQRELYLLHITRDELALGSGPGSALHDELVDRQADDDGLRFAALLGDFRFGATQDDLTLLESLGQLARAAGAPFVGEADASLLGCAAINERPDPKDWAELDAALAQRWKTLRASPVASFVGLVLPRVLLRLPYGARTDLIDAFAFEELSPVYAHESLLWGNAALACGLALAGTASSSPGQIDDLPAFVRSEAGETRLAPCAEVLLGERGATAMLGRGLMPLSSFRDRNAVRLVRLQSIADPPRGLGAA